MLYRLANLESVWVYLEIYEYELPWVRYGQTVEIKSEAYPGETLHRTRLVHQPGAHRRDPNRESAAEHQQTETSA